MYSYRIIRDRHNWSSNRQFSKFWLHLALVPDSILHPRAVVMLRPFPKFYAIRLGWTHCFVRLLLPVDRNSHVGLIGNELGIVLHLASLLDASWIERPVVVLVEVLIHRCIMLPCIVSTNCPRSFLYFVSWVVGHAGLIGDEIGHGSFEGLLNESAVSDAKSVVSALSRCLLGLWWCMCFVSEAKSAGLVSCRQGLIRSV